MALPDFIDVGQRDLLLPPGVHPGSLDEVRARLVDTEPRYRRRVQLWDNYRQFRTMVAGFLPIKHEYLDGSFVTSRAAPKDTDVSMWVDMVDIDALSNQASRWQAFLLLWSQRMAAYDCDAYLVTPCEPTHPGYGEFQYWKSKTEAYWSAYNNRAKVVVPGVVKGYVEVVE